MNLKKAKRLRKYIAQKLPFCTDEPIYTEGPTGQRMLDPRCKRHHYRRVKRNLKRGVLSDA